MRFLLLFALAGSLLVAACGGPSAVGRWQVEGNPNAGLEIRPDNTYSGELGTNPANPRLRLEGRWRMNGSDLVLEDSGPLSKLAGSFQLTGRIQGDTMTISPPDIQGLSGTITLKKQPR